MNLSKPLNLLLIALVVLYSSCSLQKRHYRQGFYVSNMGKEQISNKNTKDSSISHLDSSKVRSISLNKNSKYNHNCDTLLLNDGNTLLCKIEQVSKRSVRFKDCNDSNQVLSSIDAELVSSIKFYNGREKEISNNNPRRKTQENKNLIKGHLANTGFLLAIVALLLEGILLLALFHILVLAPYLAIAFVFLNALAAIFAIVFGFSSLREIRKNPEIFKGKKMVIWEIALGLLSLISWLIILIAVTI